MLAPKDVFSKLEEDNIEVIEHYEDLVYIISIKDMPPKARRLKSSGRRARIYDYKPFILKSCDPMKIGNKKSDYEELRLEVYSAFNFKYSIQGNLILPKLAIIRVINSQEYFLVEEFLTPYEEFDDTLMERAQELVKRTAKIFKAGDFIEKNIVYYKDADALLFTDVFPTKEHLVASSSSLSPNL